MWIHHLRFLLDLQIIYIIHRDRQPLQHQTLLLLLLIHHLRSAVSVHIPLHQQRRQQDHQLVLLFSRFPLRIIRQQVQRLRPQQVQQQVQLQILPPVQRQVQRGIQRQVQLQVQHLLQPLHKCVQILEEILKYN